jgi:ABC-type antimicrobial peptide transport system permease subunit
VLVVLAVLGVVLAAVGLFGAISYSVGQRTREIGVRMTFGATRGRIARLVVGEGIVLALCGIALGLVGAVSATRIIQHVLPNVSRVDPVSLGAGAIVLLGVSLAACFVPMMRATGVDPVIAVRAE